MQLLKSSQEEILIHVSENLSRFKDKVSQD